MALTFPVQVLLPDDILVPFLILLAMHVGFAIADTRTVKAAGCDASLLLALLLGMFYLWGRPRRTGQSYIIPIVATVCGSSAVALKTL